MIGEIIVHMLTPIIAIGINELFITISHLFFYGLITFLTDLNEHLYQYNYISSYFIVKQ